MIIVKVECLCGKWIQIRTMKDDDWVSCWNCGRRVSVSRKGGKGARIVGKSAEVQRRVNVDYEE
jgi:hypothetical protein